MKARKISCFVVCLTTTFCAIFNSNVTLAQAQEPLKQPATNIDISQLNYLTPEEKEKIARNGFVIFIAKRSSYHPEDEALSIYYKCKGSHFPVFVTSDVMLHVSHLLFDWSLRFMEVSCLKHDLLNLTDAMLTQSLTYHDQIEDENNTLKEAALKNAIFFNVAKALLTGSDLEHMPDDIKETIEKERALINEHAGFSISPLFGYEEDYSQYIPRGHYSRSPELERYFKAMMWYGRMGFRLNPLREVEGKLTLDSQAGTTETLQALLLCKALGETKIKGESALAVWERIYETTSFFAGRSDDLTVKEYKQFMDEIYGQNCPLSDLSDEQKLTQFVRQARQLRKPEILSTFTTDIASRAVPWKTQTQSLRFMGQRFTPDSHIFQNLVYDKVKLYTGDDPKPFTAVFANGVWFRGFPKALDIMATLGSQVAQKILLQQKDTLFGGYEQQFLKMRGQYAFTDTDKWTRDLYWSRMWTLRSILDKPTAGVPFFMRSEAWLKKQLNTALGSWTELKHDTIVYTKQPYSMAQMAMASKGGWSRNLPAETVHGYVEPVPELYSRIRQSVEQLRLKFASLGFPSDSALENNLKSFEGILTSLETISKKELAGEIPTESEYQLIENIGRRLSGILRYAHYIDVTDKFRSEMDNKMPLVADVFTEVNSSQVLEEAIGRPAEIFVIANVDGKDKVCLGVAYSYYEFKHPVDDRLTDERWRAMVQENKQPPIPEWLGDIVVIQE